MLTILVLLLQLLAVLVVFTFILQVVVTALEYQPELEKDTLSEAVIAVLGQCRVLLEILLLGVLSTLSLILAHFIANWKLYVLMGIAAAGGHITTRYGRTFMKAADRNYIVYWKPFNRLLIVPILNVVRLAYDGAICWWNFVNSIQRIIISSFFAIARDCEGMQWSQPVSKFRTMLIAPLNVTIRFLLTGLTGRLETSISTKAVAEFITSFQPVLDCQCDDVSFAWSIVFDMIEDDSLHMGAENAVNAALELSRIPLKFLISLFDNGFYTCDDPDFDDDAKRQCYIERPPDFSPVTLGLCNATINLTDWVDNSLAFAIEEFFGDLFAFPPVGPLVSYPTCAALDVVEMLLDALWHFDLVVGPTLSYKVHYLKELKIDTFYEHLYAFSDVGIVGFWDAFDTTYTDDLGCGFSKLTNVLIRSSEFVGKGTIVLMTEPDTFLTYVDTFDLDGLKQDGLDGISCIANFVDSINHPLGEMLKYFVRAIVGVAVSTVQAFAHIDPDNPTTFYTYVTTDYSDDLDDALDDMNAFAISFGNFWRQMRIDSADTTCDAEKPVTSTATVSGDNVDFFCCLGNLLENFLRFNIEVIRWIKDILLNAIAGNSNTIRYTILPRLKTTIRDRYDDMLDGVGCLVSSFIPSFISCEDDDDVPMAVRFKQLIVSILNLLSLPMNFAEIIVTIIESPQDACAIIKGIYELGIGNGCQILEDLGDLVACWFGDNAFGSSLKTFTHVINDIFGSDGTFINDLCTLLDVLSDVISFLSDFFRDPVGAIVSRVEDFFNDLIASFTEEVLGPIQDAINYLSNRLQSVINSIKAIFSCIGTAISGFFNNLGKCILSCLDFSCGSSCNFKMSCPNLNLKRQVYENETYEDEESGLVFWDLEMDNSTHPCKEIFMLLNDTYDPGVRFSLGMELKRCLTSAFFARAADMAILNVDHNAPSIVHPAFLYDPLIGMDTLKNATFGVNAAIEYINLQENISFYDFTDSVGVVDPLGVRIAELTYTIWTSIVRNDTNTTSAVSGLLKLVNFVWKYTLGVWPTLSTGLTEVITAYNDNSEEINKRVYTAWYDENSVAKKAVDLGTEWFLNQTYTTKMFVVSKMQTNDTRVIKNRLGISRVANLIAKHVEAKAATLSPEQLERIGILTGFASKMKRVDVELCINDNCANCTLVETIIERLVNAILQCIDDYSEEIIVDPDEFLADWKDNHPDDVYYESEVIVQAATAQDADNFNLQLLRWIETIGGYIWSGLGNLVGRSESGGSFMTNPDVEDPNSLLYWIRFLSPAGCKNFETMTRCRDGTNGRGLRQAIIDMFWLFVALAAIAVLFSPAITIIAIVAGFSFVILMVNAYMIAPFCMISTHPLYPNCLADDAFALYKQLDTDCIQWDSLGLPGLMPDTCPTQADDYERAYYVDCAAAPYKFTDGYRNVFFWLEWQVPEFAEFLREVDAPVLSWINQVSYFGSRQEFDFGDDGITDAWTSCHKSTAFFNLTTLLIFHVLAIILILIAASVAFRLLGVLAGLFAFGMIIVMEIVLHISRGRMIPSQFFKRESDLPKRATDPTYLGEQKKEQ
jgi:hypothetical protein